MAEIWAQTPDIPIYPQKRARPPLLSITVPFFQEKVYVHVDPTNALLAMKLLYTRVKSVSLFVWAPTPRTNDDVFDLLLSVLEVRTAKEFIDIPFSGSPL